MQLPETIATEIAEAIDLDPAWVTNLLAVLAAPLACLPARHLPSPARRTVEAMRGAGLLSGWDKRGERGERLGLYVTLTPWAAECLGAGLDRIPHRGPRRREIVQQLEGLELDLSTEEPLQWGYTRTAQTKEGWGWRANPEVLSQASYLPPAALIEETEPEPAEATPGPRRCSTQGCRREPGIGTDRCLKCREAALRRLVKRHDREREEEKGARRATGRVRMQA